MMLPLHALVLFSLQLLCGGAAADGQCGADGEEPCEDDLSLLQARSEAALRARSLLSRRDTEEAEHESDLGSSGGRRRRDRRRRDRRRGTYLDQACGGKGVTPKETAKCEAANKCYAASHKYKCQKDTSKSKCMPGPLPIADFDTYVPAQSSDDLLTLAQQGVDTALTIADTILNTLGDFPVVSIAIGLIQNLLGLFWGDGHDDEEKIPCGGQTATKQDCQWVLIYKFVKGYVQDQLDEYTIHNQQLKLAGFGHSLRFIMAMCADWCTLVDPSTLSASEQATSSDVQAVLCKDPTNKSTCPYGGKVVTEVPENVKNLLASLHLDMMNDQGTFMWPGQPVNSTVYFSQFASMHIQIMLALYHMGYNGTTTTTRFRERIDNYITYAQQAAKNFAAARKAMVKTGLEGGSSSPPSGVAKNTKYYFLRDTYKTDVTQKLCWSETTNAEFKEDWQSCLSADVGPQCSYGTEVNSCKPRSVKGMELIAPKVKACYQNHADNVERWINEVFLEPYMYKPARQWEKSLDLVPLPVPLLGSVMVGKEGPESPNEKAIDEELDRLVQAK